MGEKLIWKIIYIPIALFFGYAMIMAFFQSSGDTYEKITEELIENFGGELIPENEGKLVLINGKPYFDEDVVFKDEEYGVEITGVPCLNKIAEQYCYYIHEYEVEEYENGKKYSYDEDTDTYEENRKVKRKMQEILKGWVNASIQDERVISFKGKNYENPKSNIEGKTYRVPIYLGEFIISEDLYERLYDKETKNYDDLIPGENNDIGKYHIQKNDKGTFIRTGEDGNPQIGDYRIYYTFRTMNENEGITIVGKQVGNTIERYDDGNINLEEFYEGILSKDEVLKEIKEEFGYTKMGIIFMGIILAVAGYFVFRKE